MTASELRVVTDTVRAIFPNSEIFREIKSRALNGYYNCAGYDTLEEHEIEQLKSKGFKVTIGQNKKSPWYVIEW